MRSRGDLRTFTGGEWYWLRLIRLLELLLGVMIRVKSVERRIARSEQLGSGASHRHKETGCTSMSREVIQCSDPAEDGPSYDGVYKFLKQIPRGLVVDLLA